MLTWGYGLVRLVWFGLVEREKENHLRKWFLLVRVLANVIIHFLSSLFVKQCCGDFLLQILLDSGHLNK